MEFIKKHKWKILASFIIIIAIIVIVILTQPNNQATTPTPIQAIQQSIQQAQVRLQAAPTMRPSTTLMSYMVTKIENNGGFTLTQNGRPDLFPIPKYITYVYFTTSNAGTPYAYKVYYAPISNLNNKTVVGTWDATGQSPNFTLFPLEPATNYRVSIVLINKLTNEELTNLQPVQSIIITTPTQAPTTTLAPTPPLYSFKTHTFTTAGKNGSTGPTFAEIKSAYSGISWAQNSDFLNMKTQGIQEWKVPVTGSYTIQAVGAGIPALSYGSGIDATISTTLTRGEVILILVGQFAKKDSTSNSGGAGGTFVVRGTQSSPIPIIISGGGGGRGGNGEEITSNATSNNNGQTGAGSNGSPGGTNGNGGTHDKTYFAGPGGGGLLGNGENDQQTTTSGGISFVNGGIGGIGTQYAGGFGGGAGSSGGGGGGGGGGYSGGGGGKASNGKTAYEGTGWNSGGGGGSYSINGNFISSVANNNNNGRVVITANF